MFQKASALLAPVTLAAATIAICAASAHAGAVYNFQLSTSLNQQGNHAVHYIGRGAAGTGGTVFNMDTVGKEPAGSHTFLHQRNSVGIASKVSFTIGKGSTFWNSTDKATPAPTSPAALFGSYVFNASKPSAGLGFSFAGLPARAHYTIYLYSENGQFTKYPKSTTFSISNAKPFGPRTAAQGVENKFVKGVNYVIFKGTTSASGTISGTYSRTVPTAYPESDFNGAQIVLR